MAEMYENREWGHGRRPLAGGLLNNKQHGNFHADYSMALPKKNSIGMWTHEIRVDDHNGDRVGRIQWRENTGEINDIRVAPEHQRKGVATAMYRMAQQLSGEYGVLPPKHSDDRSDQGDAWARAVGGEVPPQTTAWQLPTD